MFFYRVLVMSWKPYIIVTIVDAEVRTLKEELCKIKGSSTLLGALKGLDGKAYILYERSTLDTWIQNCFKFH